MCNKTSTTPVPESSSTHPQAYAMKASGETDTELMHLKKEHQRATGERKLELQKEIDRLEAEPS